MGLKLETDIPADKFMLDGIDTSEKPTYSVAEVAKMFFGRSPHWIRWRERKGWIELDGEKVATERTEVGARRYTLTDIEKMAHALAQTGAIDPEQLHNALRVVQYQARIYGYLPPELVPDADLSSYLKGGKQPQWLVDMMERRQTPAPAKV